MTDEEVSEFWSSIDKAAADAPESPYSHKKVKELLRVAWKLREQNYAQRQTIEALVSALGEIETRHRVIAVNAGWGCERCRLESHKTSQAARAALEAAGRKP